MLKSKLILISVVILLFFSGCATPKEISFNESINVNVTNIPFANNRSAIVVQDPRIFYAEKIAYSRYGVNISVIDKKKDLIKFGRNPNVGTTEVTIMNLATGLTEERYTNTNNITHTASTSTADNMTWVFEGHFFNGTNLTFSVQRVTLNGQNKVELGTHLSRINRIYNNDTYESVGAIYVAENVTFSGGVPQSPSATHLIVTAGEQQSQKGATTISYQDFWIVTEFKGCVLEKSTNTFATLRMEVRRLGKIFLPVTPFVPASSGNCEQFVFDPPLVIPSNTDVRISGSASTVGTDISGDISGYLAIVKD